MMRKIMVAAALALASAGCAGAARTPASAIDARTVPLTISSAKGKYLFKVEVARTEKEQERGLMYRPRLKPDRGMIFPMSPPRYASFWMKNCPAPIDMIFVRENGTIARIAQAVPYSLAPVSSGEPIAAVLEIAGGRAAQLGISPDDRVTWPR